MSAKPKPMSRPYCHGEMVNMSEKAAFICTGCGKQADYETIYRAELLGFRLVRVDLPPPVVVVR